MTSVQDESQRPSSHVIGLQPQSSSGSVVVENGREGITLVVRDAPLAEVLATLAKTQRFDLVLTAPAENRITLSLSERSLPETLDAVLAAGGFTWTTRNEVVYITSLADNGTVAPQIAGRQLMIFELDYAAADDVVTAVQALLSPVGQAWVNQSASSDNRRTKNMLTVEDLPTYLHRIEEYVTQIDQPPRQVLIEVHVLQVDLDSDNRHGVNLNSLAKIGSLDVTFDAQGFANPNAPQAFFLKAQAANMTGLIEAIKTTNDAKTLASPRILALNGQESRMQVGEQLGFRVTTTTETSTLESVEFLDVGVVLSVTPYISRDGRVLMTDPPGGIKRCRQFANRLAEQETTQVETDVLLSSGDGMVIGGLIQERDDVKSSSYLGLGNVPYLGPLFKRKQDVRKRSEIVFALIPHILPLNEAEQADVDFNVARVQDPLFYGRLCRYPRPYETRLRESHVDHLCRWEREDCQCGPIEMHRLPATLDYGQPLAPIPSGEVQRPAIETPVSTRRDVFDTPLAQSAPDAGHIADRVSIERLPGVASELTLRR